MKRVALYLRVSTDQQTVTNQRQELEAVAKRSGWEIVEVYQDRGISGAKSRQGRPGLDQLLKDASCRRFDIVGAWSVDRLARSLIDLIGLLKELHALKIDLYLHQQGLDTTTPAGEAMFGMLGIFAQFERAIIQERVRAGLARARKEGKTLGRPQIGAAAARARQEGRRPPKRLDTPEGRAKDRAELERQIRARRATGVGILKIARHLGVGTGTVQRVVNGA